MFGWGYEELRCWFVLYETWGWSVAVHRGGKYSLSCRYRGWEHPSRAVSGLGLGGAARSLEQGGQGSRVCVGLGLVGVSAVAVSAQIL